MALSSKAQLPTHPATPNTATAEPTTIEKLRGLRWSIAGNVGNTIFVQFTFFGSVFALFLRELGLSKTQMGFLFSLMPFCGLIALFIAPSVARFGYKRTFLIFWSIRKGFAALLLFTPLVASSFGARATLIYVSVIVAGFALGRAVGEVGRYPWTQEFVPSSVQGKYNATSNTFTQLAGFVAVLLAGFVVGRSSGLTGYMLLIAIGVAAGAVSMYLQSHVPGGAPIPRDAQKAKARDLTTALSDRNFLLFLLGTGLIVVSTSPLGGFIPLFMREQVGLSDGQVIYLQLGTLLASMVTSYVWGWAADRYGSKPVVITGILFALLLPLLWSAMPRFSPLSLPVALSITFVKGFVDMGWLIGSARLLFVNMVPPDKKADYMALYYAWIGITGGTAQLAAGRLIDTFQGVNFAIGPLHIDAYTPFFALIFVFSLLAALVFSRVQIESDVPMGRFAGIFLSGNPFLAAGSLIRYQFVRDEEGAVRVTERLGKSKSLLAVDELLEALRDPRFNVRFEAIIALAQTANDPRATRALVDVLNSDLPAMSVIAAWALGRSGDETALAPLREALDDRYRSVQAHSARALGTLGDADSIELMHNRLRDESDVGLRVAYASSLGKMRIERATPDILALLHELEDETTRNEMALAVARIIGNEHRFIQLVRTTRSDPGTALAQAVAALEKALRTKANENADLVQTLHEDANALAHDDLDHGTSLLVDVLHQLDRARYSETSSLILDECSVRIGEYGDARLEYVLLALHTAEVGVQ